jgi:trans-aconitate methyltransferase
MSAFWRLYSGLDRQDPGTQADVPWALKYAHGAMRVCGAGCRSGADTHSLGLALPDTLVEKAAHLANKAAVRCTELPNIAVRHGDMAQLQGAYDLIWCAGALHFLGVTEGLNAWRSALAPNGRIAFFEPCYLGFAPEARLKAFWQDCSGTINAAGIEAAGRRVLGLRRVIGQVWADYYAALQRQIATLAPKTGTNLFAVLASSQAEIDGWRAAQDQIADTLYVVEPA